MRFERRISNIQFPMSNEATKTLKYDLEARTAKFGEAIVDFAKLLTRDTVTIPLIKQLVRSGTSIGANYCEADCAESRKDFEHKIGICKKEAKETKHWLRMVVRAVPDQAERAQALWKEAHELQLIFIAIVNSSRAHNESTRVHASLEIGT